MGRGGDGGGRGDVEGGDEGRQTHLTFGVTNLVSVRVDGQKSLFKRYFQFILLSFDPFSSDYVNRDHCYHRHNQSSPPWNIVKS